MDSVLVLCNIALSYDNQLSEAYTTKGDYYRLENKPDQALNEYDKALKINQNDYLAYRGKAELATENDWGLAIYYGNKAISYYRGPLLSSILKNTGLAYYQIGFLDKAKYYFDEALKSDGDSSDYYRNLTFIDIGLEDLENMLNNVKKAYVLDTNNLHALWDLGENYSFLRQYKESLKYFKTWLEKTESLDEHSVYAGHRIG